ncbi:hypothetical protein BKA70DRAFT_1434305 [Coprinopsis sp. MPI-PUGE-AT-0042]|nr:hypothetical protein BKA70DRAFT_1434305 [Coprinopsis sp. MPI-PUGE-AT-0042]
MNDSTGLAYDSELAAEWQRRFNANMIGAVVSIALIVAELFQMLDLEVSLIWKAQWSLVKVLYIANRILPFLVLPFPVILGVGSCVLLAEALLYVRLYALSGRNKWMRIFLILNLAIVYAVGYVSLALFIHTGSCKVKPLVPSDIISTHPMYDVAGPEKALITSAYELNNVLFSHSRPVCWLGLINYHSIQDSPLLKVFYRDGVFYFIVIAVLAVVNGVTAAHLPVGYQFLLGSSQAAAHSVLVTRMVLHLKQQAASDLRRSNAVSNTYIQFELTAVSA